MDEGTRFLILSVEGEAYAIPIARLQEIMVPRGILKDPGLSEMFEGKIEVRGSLIPVLDIKKIFKLTGKAGTTLLVVKSGKGTLGVLVDAVTEILNTDPRQGVIPLPAGVINPDLRYYNGILRHKENLVLLLNEEALLP
jgi:purine-binding chemotaxis protein CheW